MVSVIMPAYNCAGYVAEAIDSVLAQDYPNLELVIVDDGSDDDTADVIKGYSDRVRLFAQRNSGPAAARNFAVAKARGDYLAFLDGDDYWLPGKISAQMRYLTQHPESRFVYGRFIRWEQAQDGSFLPSDAVPRTAAKDGVDAPYSGSIYTKLLLDNIVHIITALIHRSVYDSVGGFDESLRTGEDYDFWLRVSRSFMADRLARDVALYRIHSTASTTVPRATHNEYTVLCRALERHGRQGPHGEVVDEKLLKNRLMRLCFSQGYRHYWRGDACTSAQAFTRCRDYGGTNLRITVYWLLARLRCFWSRRTLGKIGGRR